MSEMNELERRLGTILSQLNTGKASSTSNDDGAHGSAVCGIVAVVGPPPLAKDVSKKNANVEARRVLLQGLKILQNRGYDSAGMTTLCDGKLVTTKFASTAENGSDAIERLVEASSAHSGHSVGIAHTRWATHGGKTDGNAHPHHDASNRFALIHNGIINNADELRETLRRDDGVAFRSETDTEVIVQLIAHYVLREGMSVQDAIHECQKRLDGAWGICVVDAEQPDRVFAACNGSPLLLGIGDDRMFLASEAAAFAQYTNRFIPLQDGEVVAVTAAGHELSDARIEAVPEDDLNVQTSPAPFLHWTIKEIMEQPEAISRALSHGGRIRDATTVKLGGLEEKLDRLAKVRHLVIGACGTSLNAGKYGAALMRQLHSFASVRAVDASEIGRDDFPRPATETGFLVLSQSGETKDVHSALQIAAELDVVCFSVVNRVRSLIARFTDCGVYVNAGREQAVASTKCFTSQVIVLALVAIWFSQQTASTDVERRARLVDSLHRAATLTGMAIRRVRSTCRRLAQHQLLGATSMFVLGKGLAEPIAYEGALKIKEITYVHCEGFAGGALKHGPFALIEPGTPIALICLDDAHLSSMHAAAAEVKARDAYTIVITDAPKGIAWDGVADVVIPIPSNGVLTALLANIPLQLIAYELAVARNLPCDKPRHLAKSVTVGGERRKDFHE
jgi:glutamine---fructose-6-phosphate transaminase (isomerizing)